LLKLDGGKIYDKTAGSVANEFETKDKYTVSEDLKVDADTTLTIPAGKTLEVAAGKTLEVAQGATLEVEKGATLTVAKGAEVTVTKGGTLEVTQGATLTVAETATVAVADGAKLDVAADAKVAVAEGATLEVTGTLDVAEGATVTVAEGATVEVAGDLELAKGATLEVTGTLDITSGGTGHLDGTIKVAAGGVSYDRTPGGGSLWGEDGSGEYIFESGAKAYVVAAPGAEPSFLIGGPLPESPTAADYALINLAEGATFSNTKTTYTLKGDAQLNAVFSVTDFVLTAGSTVTVSGTSDSNKVELKIRYQEAGRGAKGEPGAKIVLKNQCSIITIWGTDHPTWHDNIGDIDHNFYDKDGKKITANSLKNNTYTWAADADSDTVGNQPGWKAGS
jgi:hypothetical protein